MAPRMDERLVRAKAYLAIAESGDSKREAYKRAAKEIVAYRTETKVAYATIADALAVDRNTVRRLHDWYAKGCPGDSPYAGKEHADNRALAHTKRILRDQPMETIERIIDELPEERQTQIAAAAHDSYFQRRKELEQQRRNKTPQDEREIDEFMHKTTKPIKDMFAKLSANSVVECLKEATEDLRRMVETEGGLTIPAAKAIDEALEEFQREFDFAKQLAGGE